LFGWLEWVLPLGMPSRARTGAKCTNKLHRLKNNMKMNKNEETESLMIRNVPELGGCPKGGSGGGGCNSDN
jgi:hypothetical protein